ncbi:hypothetical protein QUF70_15075 [Desulfobacterales bacterium HSG17]|nr:hypothetical protein [Desulfobacterales bacterium HSG17]
MKCDIILTRQKDKYIAKPKDWPDITVRESTRDQAIDQVKKQLTEYLAEDTEIVQIEVPVPLSSHKANPWTDNFGKLKDNSSFDDLQARMAGCRQKTD